MERKLMLCTLLFWSVITINAQVGKVGINTTSPAAMLHVMDSSVVFTAPAALSPTPPLPPLSGAGIRMMWYAEKGAFRTGRVQASQWDRDSIGLFSFAAGLNTKAKGAQAFAMGNGSNATGTNSVAIGSGANATGGGATAIGTNTTASGTSSSVFGSGSIASGNSSTAMGSNSLASGNISTALGASTMATGNNSTAIGASTKASGVSSTAMGNGTQAMGIASTAAGFNTRALGTNTTALGFVTQANGFSSLAIGQYNDTIVAPQSAISATTPLLIVGNGDPGMPSNALVIRKDGRVGVGTNIPDATLDVNGQIKISGGSPAAGKVLTSDATGLASWQTPQGGADNLGNHMATENIQTKGFYISNDGEEEGIYIAPNGHVGINTNMPMAQLHVRDSSVVFSAPSLITPAYPPPVSGPGFRMMWYPRRCAFRAGSAGMQWERDSIGFYSLAMGAQPLASYGSVALGIQPRAQGSESIALGSYTKAYGNRSAAIGYMTSALGDYAFASGRETSASGLYSVVFGHLNQASGTGAMASGLMTKASGTRATAMGSSTRANGYSSLVVGVYNDSIIGAQTDIDPLTPLLIVGNGDADNLRSNALMVRKDGRVGIGTSTPLAQLHVDQGMVLFRGSDNPPFPAGDLPDTGAGTRLLWFPDKSAFRASYNTNTEWNKDSIGYNSIAAGYSVVASGNSSTAFGLGSHASGQYAFVAGNNCHATADFSIALGWNGKATGIGSFSNGLESEARGPFSRATGFQTLASGAYSSTMGRFTQANGYASLVLGIYNDTLISIQGGLSSTTPLLIVGNGDDEDNTSNAFVVRKDGHVGVGNVNPQYGLHVSSFDNANGGWVDGVVVQNFAALAGEATIAFKNAAMPASNQWIMGVNESPPHLSLAYGSSFTTTNTHITVDTLGRYGINTTSPQAMLHLIRNNPSGGLYHASAHSIFESNNNSYMQMSSENSDETGILSGNQETSIRSAVVFSADSSLHLRSGGNSTRLAITKSGNVGIGTTTPNSKLHVRNGSSGGTVYPLSDIVIENASSTFLSLMTPASVSSGILFSHPTDNLDGSIIYNTISNPNGFDFRNNGNNIRMVINGSGDVGIGTSAPAFRLQVSTNSAAKPTSSAWTVSSDARLKRNIHAYTDGLDHIMKIHPVWFTYTGEAGLPEDTGVGVLAQELRETAPYMVGTWTHKEEDGRTTEYLSVDNGAMTYMLINAVKEQQKVIETQQSEMEALRQELADIRMMVRELMGSK